MAREWRREREKRPSEVCRRVGTEGVMAREEREAKVGREVMRANMTAASLPKKSSNYLHIICILCLSPYSFANYLQIVSKSQRTFKLFAGRVHVVIICSKNLLGSLLFVQIVQSLQIVLTF